MPFHRYGKTRRIERNEHVEIHVRDVTLNADDSEDNQVQAVEIREYIKAGEVYGHGLVIPLDVVPVVSGALITLLEETT